MAPRCAVPQFLTQKTNPYKNGSVMLRYLPMYPTYLTLYTKILVPLLHSVRRATLGRPYRHRPLDSYRLFGGPGVFSSLRNLSKDLKVAL